MTNQTRLGKILRIMSTIFVVYVIIAAIVFVLVPKARYWAAWPLSIIMNIYPFVIGRLWDDPAWSKKARAYVRIIPLCLVGIWVLIAGFLAIFHRPAAALDTLWRAPFWVMLYILFFFGRLVSRRRSRH